MRLASAVLVAVAFAVVGGGVRAAAAPGDLDPAWGQRGAVRIDMLSNPKGFVIVRHAGVSRGELSLVGDAFDLDGGDGGAPFALRLSAAGRPDTRFAPGGLLWGRSSRDRLRLARLRASFTFGAPERVLRIGRCRYNLHALLRQPDRRIVYAAWPRCGANDTGVWTVVRMLPDGTLDRTFGTRGISRIRVGIAAFGVDSGVRSGLRLPSGKVVLGGATAVRPADPISTHYALALAQ